MTNDLSIVRDVLGDELSPDSIDSAVRNSKNVIHTLVEAWYPRADFDELPARRPGELSYFIPASEWSATDRGQEVSRAYDGGLTALLYAHRIVINSPLLMLSSAFMRGKSIEWCTNLLFTSLHLLHSLKELIDANIVVIIGSDGNYYNTSIDEILSGAIGESAFTDLDLRMRRSIEFSLASGCAADIFVDSDAQFTQLLNLLGSEGEKVLVGPSDAKHLSTLIEEIVPDASELDVSEVARIREDDSFEQWRSDLRTAIRRMIVVNSNSELAGQGLEEVQMLMHEKAIKIHEAVSASGSMTRLRLREHIASFAIGGIGAASVAPIVGEASVSSEVAMLGGSLSAGTLLVGLSAIARSLRSPQRGNHALAHHYAFVGKCAKLSESSLWK